MKTINQVIVINIWVASLGVCMSGAPPPHWVSHTKSPATIAVTAWVIEDQTASTAVSNTTGILSVDAADETEPNHQYILPGTAHNNEGMGSILARGDFSGTGRQCVVIGARSAYTYLNGEGAVYIVCGGSSEVGLGKYRVITPYTGQLAGRIETFSASAAGTTLHTGGHFGAAVAAGDFDGNGYDDLAIGAAGSVTYQKGQVVVIYSYPKSPLKTTDARLQVLDETQVGGTAEDGDQFGLALAAGDFNGDGYADLAVGIPCEDDGDVVDAGAVRIVFGSATGLDPNCSVRLRQGEGGIADLSETGDGFGLALATGDFNADSYDDLAVAAPYEDHSGKTDAGIIFVFWGSSKALATFNQNCQTISQSNLDLSVDEGAANNEKFGWCLATGHINGDPYADLVVGVPFEDTDSANSSGEVNVFYGGSEGFSYSQMIDQDSEGAAGEIETGDEFGYAVAVGDVDQDGYDDVAVGVPCETYNGIREAGLVHLFYGTLLGLSTASSLEFKENQAPVGAAESEDHWGSAVLLADTNGDGFDDLIVGVPGEDYGDSVYDMGSVHWLPADGSSEGFDQSQTVVIRKAP